MNVDRKQADRVCSVSRDPFATPLHSQQTRPGARKRINFLGRYPARLGKTRAAMDVYTSMGKLLRRYLSIVKTFEYNTRLSRDTAY